MKTSTIGLQESQGLPDYMKTSTIGLQESQGLPDYMKNLHYMFTRIPGIT